ncbi:MAG: NAD(+) kinase [Desulfuromonas sp.]|nr:MAG: NAD(+) kinase [Desulfuromonas sp.]
MKRVGIYAKKHHPNAVSFGREVMEWLTGRGVEVFLEEDLASALEATRHYVDNDIPDQAELIVVLGGDGTLISVARHVGHRMTPILGVNLGSLGFLTEITREETFSTLERVFAGNYQTSRRLMLEAVVRRQDVEIARYSVLNDAVINKGALARIIDMAAWVDGAYLTTFKADGLIITTPTGSTAYNLAAGGPIVHPDIDCMAITPICPHMLTNRPLIVGGSSEIRIEVKFQDEDVVFTADGQVGMPLQGGDVVELRKAPCATLLIRSPSKDYYEVLRTKLRWGER